MAYILTDDQQTMLAAFLRRQSGFMHVWGTTDCGLMAADWVMAAKGVPDPASDIRGRYDTEAGAEILLEPFGGLEGYVTAMCEEQSLKETDAPIDGDVGLIFLPTVGPTCGLHTRGSWAFRTTHGLAWSQITAGRLMRAWGVFRA